MNATAAIVAEVFRDVFQTRHVTLDSDFFELGGESHEAVTIALLLEDQFGIELPIDLIEEATTVRALAAWIDAARER